METHEDSCHCLALPWQTADSFWCDSGHHIPQCYHAWDFHCEPGDFARQVEFAVRRCFACSVPWYRPLEECDLLGSRQLGLFASATRAPYRWEEREQVDDQLPILLRRRHPVLN